MSYRPGMRGKTAAGIILLMLGVVAGCHEKTKSAGHITGGAAAGGDGKAAGDVSATCGPLESFKKDLWQPLVGQTCMSCHRSGGFAQYSPMVFRPVESARDLFANFSILRGEADKKTESGDSLLLAKPTLKVKHDGNKVLEENDPRFAALSDFVKNPPDLSLCDPAELGTSDPLKDDKDASATRLLRRASLAIRGSLPELAEYQAIQGGKAYESFVDEYLQGDGLKKMVDRFLKHYVRSLFNNFVAELRTFKEQGVGRGVVWRPRDYKLGMPHMYTPPPLACISAPNPEGNHETFVNWGTSKPTSYENCVLEAPLKTWELTLRRIFLPTNHPEKLSWGVDNYGGFYNTTPLNVMRFDFSNVPNESPHQFYHLAYYPNAFTTMFRSIASFGEIPAWGYGWGHINAARGIPSPEEYPEMWRPGWFSGCLLPGEEEETDASWQQILAKQRRPRLDMGNNPIRPRAYRAVKVSAWWGGDVWACPGLAISEALAQGVITRPPPFYRRNAQNADASEFLVKNYIPTTIDGMDWREYLRQRYPKLGEVAEAAARPLPPYQDGNWYQGSASNFDVAFNPAADCGKNLRYCNPLPDLQEISASFEAPALFKRIVEGKRPLRDFLDGKVRVTNRALEWLYFQRQVEGMAILDNKVPYTVTEANMASWMPAGTWPTKDPMTFLGKMPPLPNTAWPFQAANPDLYNHDQGAPEFAPGWDDIFVLSTEAMNMPMVGVVSSAQMLNLSIVNRTRANKLRKFFQCQGFPPASGDFKIDPNETALPPRSMVKSGCAGCHNQGGVDPYASHFMAISGDILNTNFNFDYKRTLLGFHYVPPEKIVEFTGGKFYGLDPQGQVDAWKGVPATQGLPRLAEILGEEPGYTRCNVSRTWEILLSRMPTPREEFVFNDIVRRFEGKSYTLQDLVHEIATSTAFRKAP